LSGAAAGPHLRAAPWRLARVVGRRPETARVTTLVLEVPGWPGHRPGQHVEVRLTAEDGYQAVRSYSLGSPPEEPALALTIERLGDGEVSPYLADEVRPGDHLELRGPLGHYFVWDASCGGPLLLVAGGSGVVPLMAMLRHRARAPGGRALPARLLYSCRSPQEAVFGEELARLSAGDPNLGVHFTFTRTPPPGWTGLRRRVDAAMLTDLAWPAADRPHCFVCGPAGFVESAASALRDLGHAPERIRTERFGPTGLA
jgi:ferredoxin-NADP reductase